MSGTKLAKLKITAKEFVDTVLSSDPDGRVAISIVPYNAQVNLGPVLRAKYTANHNHGVAGSNCFELTPALYSNPHISTSTGISMMAHADISSSSNTSTHLAPTNFSALPSFSNVHCKTTTANIVRLPSQNIVTLKAQIDGLVASGNTSIMAGTKWGIALLDPGPRPMFTSLVADNAMASVLDGRPFGYDDPEAIKVVVLMTDGEHVSHQNVVVAFKTGA